MTAKNITPNDFGRLFLKYRDRFIPIAHSYTRDEAVAEDIVAELLPISGIIGRKLKSRLFRKPISCRVSGTDA